MATYTDNYNLIKPTMAESADIRTINGNMDSIDNILHASQVSLAPAYNANSTYNTGDVVMYELLMYECLDDDVTGAWDATKWQRTTAGEHGGGGGGSNVSITPTLQSGTKIADFEINGVSGALYAPSGGGGGGGSDGVIEGLDYDRAETLTLPDFTGYTYTPTEDGVLILKAYGSVGGVSVLATGYDDLSLAVLGDTWTCPWIPVNKSTEYTLKRMAQSSGFPSDSWLKFIPWKRGVFLAPMIYSTEEREVGAWVDDKPLYAKSVTTGGTAPTGTTLIQRVEQTDYDTLYYTKDSDVAGSGSYGSLGIPMEHYDNTEKVVGTWLGDTLYEKTFNVSSLSCTTSDYFGSYSGSLDLSGYIGSYDEVFVDLDMSYLTTSGGVKERFVLVQALPNSTSINLFTCASRSNVSAVLTVRYTKSTT